ncbi:MAG TPA: cupin domain-containing protein [Candidatus Binatia bacterium]|nr:cupin domain-containing protein [Candidatus Binatia bacterium]
MAKPEPRSEGDRFREAFHERMHANNMYGLWELASQMTPNPRPKMVPHMWPWSLTKSIIEESARAVPVGDERRALQLFNPGLGGRWATTNNLIAAVQVLLPGEVARAHRHTPTAIRFIIEGTGAYTAVDGERVYMAPGDLILTPSWAWHDHGNETQERVVWMDGLDIPLIASLEAMFFQFYSSAQVPVSRPANSSRQMYGHAHITPTWVKEKTQFSPLLLYSWEQAWQALNSLRAHEGSPHDGIVLEYRHPQTAGPVLPTMACMIQLLRPGEQTKAHRHTGSAVYHVVQGEGATIIDGQRFDWRKGDILTVPPWALHEHANASKSADAVLFSIQDLPVLSALGLYYEEAYTENDGHQMVTSSFKAA